MSPNIVKMIAVHYANKSGRGQAATFVPYSTAAEMVDARLAVWNKKATYINLVKTEAEISRADRSLTMGPAVIFANACGEDLVGEALVDEGTSELKSCSVELEAGDLILFDEDFTT